ncbi:MAG: AMP-dependent synthetase/ligase, partial [Phycisphaerae bacterium]
ELLDGGGASISDLNQRIEGVRPDDLCMVMYTSGTTGPPKGVKLCHRNILSQQKAIELLWDVGENDATLSYLPWHHSFGGLFERFMALYHGVMLCLDDSRGRSIERLIDNWQVFKPTLFFSVPRVHDQLVEQCRQHPEVSDLVFSKRLRFVFTAGAPLPARVEAAYHQHDIPTLEGWGLTETSPCVTLTAREQTWRSGYVGRPLPGVTVRIDSDQEILVKGPNVMGGYLDDEEATSRVFDNEGWFHTGDLGEFTSEGLRLFGRKDGAFKLTTGEKVHPQRIENVLVNESPYINLALVVGKGEDFVGALLFPDPVALGDWAAGEGMAPVDEPRSLVGHPAVRALMAAELERINPLIEVKYQRIKRAVLIDRDPSLANGELTPSGKIVRNAVIAHYKRQLDGMFAPHAGEDVIEVERAQLQKT